MKSQKCLICRRTTKYFCGNIFQLKTSASTTPINTIIKRISGRNALVLEQLPEGFSCQECLLKIDEYDEAYTRAKRLEMHLQYLLDDKSKVQRWDHSGSNIIFRCKKVESSESNKQGQSTNVCLFKSDNIELLPGSRVDEVNQPFENIKEASKCEFFEEGEDTATSLVSPKEETYYIDDVKLEDRVRELPQWNECDICGTAFSSKSKLSKHKQTHKSREKCGICNKSFKTEILLEIHRQTHDGKSELECVDCSKVFSSKCALVKHRRIHRGEYIYQCEQCGKQFIHDSSMRMHRMVHADSREKKCTVCNRAFRSTQHLNRHLRTHTGEKPYFCKKCGKRFAQKYNMMSHYSKVHSIAVRKRVFPCSYCTKAFAQHFHLSEHIRHYHSNQRDFPASVNGNEINCESGTESAEYLYQPEDEEAVISVG